MLKLEFITVDTFSLKPRILGTSFFPLFIDCKTQMPCLKDVEKRTLHTGAY